MKRLEFVNGVSEALNWYVSDRRFQATLPTFREQLKDLRKAIERFQSAIPDEDTLLDHFLHATYTGEVFLRDQRKPSKRELTALQDRWQKHIGFPAIQSALNTMLRNIEAAQLLIGNRKPRDHQVKGFVQTLAEVWKKATGTWPSNTRDPDSNKQTGRFADFVRATNEILPRTFRIPSLDAAIRTACEATDGSSDSIDVELWRRCRVLRTQQQTAPMAVIPLCTSNSSGSSRSWLGDPHRKHPGHPEKQKIES